ncbi:MAG: MerR family DNA-binding transcriptional regulator [Anaerolineae bacterium]|nr:MerR family DNA-binding transcriptional regulator [Anaerolineae bacterium]
MKSYTTKQVAEMAGVHRDTLLRWLREKRVPEPERDRNGWRRFTDKEVEVVVNYAQVLSNGKGHSSGSIAEQEPYIDSIVRLQKLDWDFADAKTGFLTHAIHPYPAKFIPQIPNALIQELSSVGDTILDPFCGSGTTLVEALRLDRHAIGVDANPLACLISQAKTTRMTEDDARILFELAEELSRMGHGRANDMPLLFPELSSMPDAPRPTFKGVHDWFDEQVIDELAHIKSKCLKLETEHLRRLSLVAMSAIIVTVSRQDSDTRYVRRKKNISLGDTLQQFSRSLRNIAQKSLEFSDELQPYVTANVHNANILTCPDIGEVDLVVCSPPYPNAYSYHLYHRTRMLWLDMDQPQFKKEEIGSHRKYSHKGANAATVDTFREEMRTILDWLREHLHPNRHACFVIGDSTLKGEKIKNDRLIIEVAEDVGFKLEANIPRRLQSSKKSFNPTIGNIRQEHIVILRNKRT